MENNRFEMAVRSVKLFTAFLFGRVVSIYDKKMFRMIVDSTAGDKVKVQFPVGAVKKILKVTGKLLLSMWKRQTGHMDPSGCKPRQHRRDADTSVQRDTARD